MSRLKKYLYALSLGLALGGAAHAQSLLFEDFSNYSHTTAMVANWERFGLAVGEPELGEGFGRDQSNALLGPLRWQQGNNANFRRVNLPVTDWRAFSQVEVLVRLETAHRLNPPSTTTTVRLVLEDTAGRFWQTDATQAKIPSVGGFSALRFTLAESEMGPRGAFSLANLKTFRLRFENSPQAAVGQLAYIDSIHLVANLVEVAGVRIHEAVELFFEADWGQQYQIQRSTDLRNWVDDGPPLTGSCEIVGRMYSIRHDHPAEFFRVVVVALRD